MKPLSEILFTSYRKASLLHLYAPAFKSAKSKDLISLFKFVFISEENLPSNAVGQIEKSEVNEVYFATVEGCLDFSSYLVMDNNLCWIVFKNLVNAFNNSCINFNTVYTKFQSLVLDRKQDSDMLNIVVKLLDEKLNRDFSDYSDTLGLLSDYHKDFTSEEFKGHCLELLWKCVTENKLNALEKSTLSDDLLTNEFIEAIQCTTKINSSYAANKNVELLERVVVNLSSLKFTAMVLDADIVKACLKQSCCSLLKSLYHLSDQSLLTQAND